jgi:regulatory protein
MSRKITGIKLQKKNRNRVNIYINGEFSFGLSRFTAAWLKEGMELSDEKISDLLEQDKFEVAYQRALNYLKYREHSREEILRYLRKNKVSEEVAEQVTTRLQENGLLDDVRFTQMWIENRIEYRPRSRRALRLELRRHGIDDEIIEQSLTTVDENEAAYKAAKKYAHRLENKDWDEFRQKLYGYLGRRGFNYETSKSIINQVWEERNSPNNII